MANMFECVGKLPAHVNKAVERLVGAGGVKFRHLRGEVVDGDHFAHRVCHSDVCTIASRWSSVDEEWK